MGFVSKKELSGWHGVVVHANSNKHYTLKSSKCGHPQRHPHRPYHMTPDEALEGQGQAQEEMDVTKILSGNHLGYDME